MSDCEEGIIISQKRERIHEGRGVQTRKLRPKVVKRLAPNYPPSKWLRWDLKSDLYNFKASP